MSQKPSISAIRNGPLVVRNCPPLRRSDGTRYETEGSAALCRCGGSKNKPFCDGTHAEIGFRDAPDPKRVPDRRDDYAGEKITVHDNRGICAHAGRCTDGLPAVFRLRQEPWIDPDAAPVEELVATIAQCPSGALSHSIGGEEHRDRPAAPEIVVVPNGPYAVRGGAELAGVEWGEGASREHFTLCRCGKSRNKPFCSGAHWKHHFDEHAPAPGGD